MMPKDYSPFTPGQLVPIDFFVGRVKEVDLLRVQVLDSSVTSRLKVNFLTGERGIGKSSLATFVRYLVEKDSEILGIYASLGGVSSLTGMARKIFDRLLKESAEKPWYGKISDLFGEHIKQVGLFGVTLEFKASREDLQSIVNNFAEAIRQLNSRLGEQKRGIYIILDDINGLATSPDFANWLKSFIDEVGASRTSLPLCLLFVGLDEKRHSLIRLQPSLARVFDIVDIQTWSKEETAEFYKKVFAEVGIEVDDDALAVMSVYAGGLPVLAQEIGDATFKRTTSNRVTLADATAGVVAAADIVGRKHLEPQVFNAIRSKSYRTILKRVGEEPFEFRFRKKEVRKLLSKTEDKAFDNFLQKMKRLGAIVPVPDEGRGVYRFQNRLHYFYFYMEAEKARKSGE
ncbi:MAG: AAA family ATPase [candidate division Zixibacteria bacterium]|nr:AAA family ATPase [candidate division Zixibacteria bacterium]